MHFFLHGRCWRSSSLRSCLVRLGDGRSCFSLSLEGWHEGLQLLPYQSDQGNQPPGCSGLLRSFKVVYEGNVVWFSLFPFTSSLEAILSVYRNSKLQKLDIFSLDDDYVWSIIIVWRGMWFGISQSSYCWGEKTWIRGYTLEPRSPP